LKGLVITVMSALDIANNKIYSATNREISTTFKDLWRTRTCVVVFFRRFG